MKFNWKYYSCILIALVLISCEHKEPGISKWETTPYNLEIPRFFPTETNIPADNPITVEGVNLGRYLFYDGRLSGRTQADSLMTCASCHVQSRNFRPGLDHQTFTHGMPVGLKGTPTTHTALPLVNLIWNQTGYTWNGGVHFANNHPFNRNIEDIVWQTVVHPNELAGDTAVTVALFQNLNGYPDLFYKAFGSSTVTMKNISKAVAQFVRTLVSANSRFDKYLAGNLQLNNQELEGLVLFTTEEGADCFHCHGSSGNPLMSTNLFYNNGKDTEFTTNDDRFVISGNIIDKGAYKATTLRNIAVSGPYMHDGRFKTLDEVIDFYSHDVKVSEYISPLMHHANDGGIQLTPSEKISLKAFLQSLTDEDFLTNPKFAAPALFPDGKSYSQVRGRY